MEGSQYARPQVIRKRCLRCNEEFIPRSRVQVYCMIECRRSAERKGNSKSKKPQVKPEHRDLTPQQIAVRMEEETQRKRLLRAHGLSSFDVDPWAGYRSTLGDG